MGIIISVIYGLILFWGFTYLLHEYWKNQKNENINLCKQCFLPTELYCKHCNSHLPEYFLRLNGLFHPFCPNCHVKLDKNIIAKCKNEHINENPYSFYYKKYTCIIEVFPWQSNILNKTKIDWDLRQFTFEDLAYPVSFYHCLKRAGTNVIVFQFAKNDIAKLLDGTENYLKNFLIQNTKLLKFSQEINKLELDPIRNQFEFKTTKIVVE